MYICRMLVLLCVSIYDVSLYLTYLNRLLIDRLPFFKLLIVLSIFT